MIAYLNGSYLPAEEITISPEDRGFLFADSLYEVIRSYEGRLFRTRSHLERLSYGARELRFPVTAFEYLEEVAGELIRLNELSRGDATVYIQVTRGAAPRTHRFPPAGTPVTVYASASPFSPHLEDLESGIGVILVSDQRWARCDIKTTGLTANVLAHQEAMDRGASEALFVRDGTVLEGTHSNLFAVFGGTVVTPPGTNYILGGITRKTVIELCADLSLPCLERPIFESRILEAQELMIVGTTTEVTPAVRVNGLDLQGGVPGEITRRLQGAFRKRVEQGP